MEENLIAYREHIKKRLADLRSLFARAAVGDFSSSIEIPDEEDEEIIELYTGVNIMLDVIKRQLEREEVINKAKSEFVALVSHQLRTPLSVIKWSVEHLQLSDLSMLGSDEREDIEDIAQETEHMVSLINTILDVSRIELGTLIIEPKQIDIIASARAAVAQANSLAKEKHITLEEHYEPEELTIAADPALLHIIFQNLLSNAVKYTPEGGTVRIQIAREAARILIEVTDTGYGIPEEERERVFSKLFRASNARKADPSGSGLGLYIVKSIITEAGGDIWFESKLGKGTSFYATFPLEGMQPHKGNARI